MIGVKMRFPYKWTNSLVLATTVMLVLYVLHLYRHKKSYHENIMECLHNVGTIQPSKGVLTDGYKVPKLVTLNRRLLIAHLVGGLGNHLWIYASLYGIAKKTNRLPIACGDDSLNKLFRNLPVPVSSFIECKKRFKLWNNSMLHIKEKKVNYYDTEMIARIKESDIEIVMVSTYLNNIGYFVEYAPEIRSQLILRERYRIIAQHLLHDLINKTSKIRNSILNTSSKHLFQGGIDVVFVSVHVRRGDALKEPHKNFPGLPYFQKAMNYFRNKFSNKLIFIVVTDDFEWSKANIIGEDVVFTGAKGMKTREEDFSIALACNHTIMSVGTFGWWIGFLTGGEVIYYKDWIKGRPWYDGGQYFPHNFKSLE